MAYSVKASDLPEHSDLHANKVVIVTGPSFGTGLKLVLFGAALGASAALYWKSTQDSKLLPATPDETTEATADRLHKLAERAKSLVSRASDFIHAAAETATPALQNAMHEAKQAKIQAETEAREELRKLDEKDDTPEQV